MMRHLNDPWFTIPKKAKHKIWNTRDVFSLSPVASKAFICSEILASSNADPRIQKVVEDLEEWDPISMWLSLFTVSSVERVQSSVTSYAHTGGRIGVAPKITMRLEQAAAPLAIREVVGGFARSIKGTP